jgi:hypothetical protein
MRLLEVAAAKPAMLSGAPIGSVHLRIVAL